MRKYVFWGLLFIVIGVLWLLKLTSAIHFSWLDFLSLWPLILIWIGIGLLPIRDGFKVLLDCVALAAGLLFVLAPVRDPLPAEERVVKSEIIYNYSADSIKSTLQTVRFDLEAGAAELNFITGAKDLVNVWGDRKENVRLSIKSDSSGREARVKLEIKTPRSNVHYGGAFDIALDTVPVWNMDVSLGATDNRLDLSPFKVSRLDLSAGASNTILKVGDLYPEVDIDISLGASAIRIEVPKSMSCTIHNESAISDSRFYGFTEQRKREYYSAASDTISKGNITMTISSGVSDIEVVKY